MAEEFKDRKKIKVSKKAFEKIQKTAIAAYPQEICGFLKSDGSFVECENQADDKENSFKISAKDYALNLDSIAVIHTHCPKKIAPYDPRTPSEADWNSQKETGIPWLIYSASKTEISQEPFQIPRYPDSNFEARAFVPGISDCFSIVQDYYWFNFGIQLKDHIAYNVKDIVLNCNSFDKYITDYGFHEVPLEELQDGDLLLIDNAGFTRNHLGIYESGKILHQDGLLIKEDYSHFVGRIGAVLRHDSR